MTAILTLALLLCLCGTVCWMEAVADLIDAGPLRGWTSNIGLGLAGLALVAWGCLLAIAIGT